MGRGTSCTRTSIVRLARSWRHTYSFSMPAVLMRRPILSASEAWNAAKSSGDMVNGSMEVAAKNRLWFDYSRPMNWAFLGGDRIEQPSSRDHRDPKVRWFPGELEQFGPLIEQAEAMIGELAKTMPELR